MSLTITVNGQLRTTPADPTTPLLYVLRNDLGLNGAKFGCGAGQCGACTVIINEEATRSCVTALENIAQNAKITTIEGLSVSAIQTTPNPNYSESPPSISSLSILQNAFIEEQAAQCGYCINGMIMTAKSFLDKNPAPSEDQIRKALDANLCRCGTHSRIIKAVQRAAQQIKHPAGKTQNHLQGARS